MSINHLLIDVVPSVPSVRNRLGDALREVQLLRRLLRLTELAEEYRQMDRHVAAGMGDAPGEVDRRATVRLAGLQEDVVDGDPEPAA